VGELITIPKTKPTAPVSSTNWNVGGALAQHRSSTRTSSPTTQSPTKASYEGDEMDKGSQWRDLLLNRKGLDLLSLHPIIETHDQHICR
jgi:hypothetical protein